MILVLYLITLLLLILLPTFCFTVTYVYDKRIRLGDDEGSEGEKDIVTDLDRPGPFDLKANITEWSAIRRISLSGYKIRSVRFYFPPGCRNKVKLKLTFNGDSWIPMDNYSDPIQGDGKIVSVVTNRVIGTNDYVYVWYRNLDSSSHRIDIQFDVLNKSASSMVREDSSKKKAGREAELSMEEYYYMHGSHGNGR